MAFDGRVFWHLLFSSDFVLPGLTTLGITVAAMAMGLVLGVVGALGRLAKGALPRLLVTAYLWLFRGTPVLVQIVFWYDATAELTNNGINLSAVVAGILALGVHEGAYMTEIVRAGIQAVDPGQEEAARALGMTPGLTMRRIVIPQAIRTILPPTGNELISLLKTTSLLFTISVPELFLTGTDLYSANFRYFEVLSVLSIWYLIFTTVFTYIQRILERRYGEDRFRIGGAGRGGWSRVFLPAFAHEHT